MVWVVGVVAALGWNWLNEPPTSNLPSACSARLSTAPFGFGSNVLSSVPSELSLTRLAYVSVVDPRLGSTVEKLPPMIICPFESTMNELGTPLGSGLND